MGFSYLSAFFSTLQSIVSVYFEKNECALEKEMGWRVVIGGHWQFAWQPDSIINTLHLAGSLYSLKIHASINCCFRMIICLAEKKKKKGFVHSSKPKHLACPQQSVPEEFCLRKCTCSSKSTLKPLRHLTTFIKWTFRSPFHFDSQEGLLLIICFWEMLCDGKSYFSKIS